MATVRVYVNDRPFVLLRGMTVKHALIAAGYSLGAWPGEVTDEWGQKIGEDGALTDEMRMMVKDAEGR